MAIRNYDCMGDAETSLRAENAESPIAGKASVGWPDSRQVQRMLPGMLRSVPAPWQRASARMCDRGYLGDHGAL